MSLNLSHSQCEPKVIYACCATHAQHPGHGAAFQRVPVCRPICTCMIVLIWLVTLRYDIPSGMKVGSCVLSEVGTPMESRQCARCGVGCIRQHEWNYAFHSHYIFLCENKCEHTALSLSLCLSFPRRGCYKYEPTCIYMFKNSTALVQELSYILMF